MEEPMIREPKTRQPQTSTGAPVMQPAAPIHIVNGIEKIYIGLRIWWHICVLAYKNYGALKPTLNALKKLWQITKVNHGGKANIKLVRNDNRYHYNIFIPGYPSQAYDLHVQNMLNRLYPYGNKPRRLSFIIFAITRKCPLRCEHCFEADNLNGKETFTIWELKEVIARFQKEDLALFHLSGGEPLVRIKDLEELIGTAGKKSEFWILTSGFNLTRENASRLKKAGATGVAISLDHFDQTKHNTLRGFEQAYYWVTEAVRNAREAGLVTAATICVTPSFLTWENLMLYTEHVKLLGFHFIQILEPKAVGAYKGKNVLLNPQQIQLLEDYYTTLNFTPAYRNYPAVVYHGYHQRRQGCFSGGAGNLYIDSAGFVNSCPFCHTKTENIKLKLERGEPFQLKQENCLIYGPPKS